MVAGPEALRALMAGRRSVREFSEDKVPDESPRLSAFNAVETAEPMPSPSLGLRACSPEDGRRPTIVIFHPRT